MRKLAVFFPGVGYHCDRPLLHQAREIATEKEYECICLTYSVSATNIRGDSAKMKQAYDEIYGQVAEQLAEVNWKAYDDIIFVAKSIGTIVACAYAMKQQIDCRKVLYTPLEYTFLFEPAGSIAFTGTDDPWVVHKALAGYAKAEDVPLYVYERANHSLETGIEEENEAILRQVGEKTREYLR